MAEINDSGWKLMKSGNSSYLVRRCFSEENFKIQLTDHKRLWSAEGTANELLLMSRKENPLCEFNLSKVTLNIFNVFDKSLDLLKVKGDDDVKLKTLTMSTSLGNRPFNLVWILSDQGPDVLYEEVTGPLLSFATEMSHRQDYLVKVIREKDMEIAEHLAENGPLKWGRVKTEKFNQEEFMGMFSSCNAADPIASAWETTDVLTIFNKNVFGCKKGVGNNVGRENSNQNEVIVKQEEVLPENNGAKQEEALPENNGVKHEEALPENNAVVDNKIGVQVKEEGVSEPSVSKVIRSKRKKVKLNL